MDTGAKFDSVPPVTSMSDRAKVLLASDSVKYTVSLAVTVPEPARLTSMVGRLVSLCCVL